MSIDPKLVIQYQAVLKNMKYFVCFTFLKNLSKAWNSENDVNPIIKLPLNFHYSVRQLFFKL